MDSSSAPSALPPHRRLALLQGGLLALGPGAALPSPTPSCDESSSDGTISDAAAADLSPASVFLHGGSSIAATGTRGSSGVSKPSAAPSHSPSTVSTDSTIAHAVVSQLKPSSAPPPSLQLVVPQRADRPRREYTCKECGMSFPTNQALGGHAAGHRNRQREAEAMATAAAMGANHPDGGAFLAELRRARREEAPHECRKFHKEFPTGVALGGHMRVHYTGEKIVPKRKSKKRALALLPVAPVGHDDDIAAPLSPGLSLALSINTEDASSPLPAPAEADGRVVPVRLFGIDISAQVQASSSSEQQCSDTTEDYISCVGAQH